ncbi:MAG: hypothetical protein JWO74_3337 [Solirubrobacterales bacterium]|nr:hypothetical protein [Solirubrobacterales bacterium]
MRTLTRIEAAPSSIAPPGSPSRPDLAPAAVRRADWRFLLPDPALGRVAYVGPHQPALVRALSALSDHLELRPPPGTLHDVVVVTRPTGSRQLAAGKLVAPGGWVYLETTGLRAGGAIAQLRGSGLVELAAWWLWPEASACLQMIPLANPAALGAALGRRQPGSPPGPRAWAAQALARCGALRPLLASVALVGRRPEGDA